MVEIEYSKALFDLASNKRDTLEEFDSFIELLSETYNFEDVLNSPSIKKSDKKEIIKNSLKDFDELFVNFLLVLIDNNRFELIKKIHNIYYEMVLNYENTLIINVYSSKRLSSSENEKLNSQIGLKTNKKVIINNIIDEKIIGGIKIEYSGILVDDTIKDKLDKIKALL